MYLLLRRASLGAVAAAFVSLANPAHAAEFPCFEQDDMQAARIHDLRVMLMVNALKCRLLRPQTLRSYGDLLDQRGEELTDQSRQVLAAMVDQYGTVQGPVAYNRYETALANYHSVPQPSRRQCEDVAAYIDLAGRADHAELATLSRLATNRAIDLCLVPVDRSDSTVAGMPEPEADFATMARASVGLAEPEMVDGIPTYNTPGTGPDTAPEPLEKVALPAAGSDSPAPQAPTVAEARTATEAEAKLDQAILALSQAVAALSDLRREP